MESLYTIVVDYLGGTYISQFNASSPDAALSKWLAADDRATKDALPRQARQATRRHIESGEEIVVLDGLRNVWCASASAKNGLVLVNIIATS